MLSQMRRTVLRREKLVLAANECNRQEVDGTIVFYRCHNKVHAAGFFVTMRTEEAFWSFLRTSLTFSPMVWFGFGLKTFLNKLTWG